MSVATAWDFKNESGKVTLKNKTKTVLRFSQKKLNYDFDELLNKMKTAGVPFSFTEHIKEIYFTVLREYAGYYLDNKIHLSCTLDHGRSGLESILVHELGHHIDQLEGLSKKQKLIEEKRWVAHRLGFSQATEDIIEYIAIGFERYYFSGKGGKSRLRRENPKLYNVLNYIHKKYKKKV